MPVSWAHRHRVPTSETRPLASKGPTRRPAALPPARAVFLQVRAKLTNPSSAPCCRTARSGSPGTSLGFSARGQPAAARGGPPPGCRRRSERTFDGPAVRAPYSLLLVKTVKDGARSPAAKGRRAALGSFLLKTVKNCQMGARSRGPSDVCSDIRRHPDAGPPRAGPAGGTAFVKK